MPFTPIAPVARRVAVPVRVRQLAATFPAGRGVNQPSGKIKVRHAAPPKTRKVARPNN